ncbi:hypothetical protein TrVE_jg11800 [Triparma verrucosa]|uniref:Exocyst complex subunit EXOC6/Sec15 C-terminal domain-containing protein n=1 Tax=Triparma verrucosa TaxID=1606542 RepID=A0A9W7CEA0_9STRA|nr:hypothetical protein TrVE_jg11800 [Triparma verrucosa]
MLRNWSRYLRSCSLVSSLKSSVEEVHSDVTTISNTLQTDTENLADLHSQLTHLTNLKKKSQNTSDTILTIITLKKKVITARNSKSTVQSLRMLDAVRSLMIGSKIKYMKVGKEIERECKEEEIRREKDEKQSILKWCMHLRNGGERRIGSQCVSHPPLHDESRAVVKESVGGDFDYVNIWNTSEPKFLSYEITFEGEEEEEEGETNKLEIMRPFFLGKMSYRQLGLEEKFEEMMEQNRVPKGLTSLLGKSLEGVEEAEFWDCCLIYKGYTMVETWRGSQPDSYVKSDLLKLSQKFTSVMGLKTVLAGFAVIGDPALKLEPDYVYDTFLNEVMVKIRSIIESNDYAVYSGSLFPFGLSPSSSSPSSLSHFDLESPLRPRTSEDTCAWDGTVNDVFKVMHEYLIVYARCMGDVNRTVEVNDTDRIIYLSLVFKLIVEIYRRATQVYIEQIPNLSQVNQSLRIVADLRQLEFSSNEFVENIFRGCVCEGVGATKIEHHNFKNYKEKAKLELKSVFSQAVSSGSAGLHEMCKTKVSSLISFCIDETNWTGKKSRDSPNTYALEVINFLKITFSNTRSISEADLTSIFFTCAGHISIIMMGILINGSGAYVNDTNYDVGYAEKINCYGVSDMRLDVGSLEAFCDDTGVSNLSQCFKELRQFTDALLDRDLGMLCEEENCEERMRRYPMLDLCKLKAVLEKYQGIGLADKMKGGGGILKLDKKDVQNIIKKIANQI